MLIYRFRGCSVEALEAHRLLMSGRKSLDVCKTRRRVRWLHRGNKSKASRERCFALTSSSFYVCCRLAAGCAVPLDRLGADTATDRTNYRSNEAEQNCSSIQERGLGS